MRPRSDEDPVRESTIWARAFNARKQAVYKDAVATNFHQHSSLQMRGSPYTDVRSTERLSQFCGGWELGRDEGSSCLPEIASESKRGASALSAGPISTGVSSTR